MKTPVGTLSFVCGILVSICWTPAMAQTPSAATPSGVGVDTTGGLMLEYDAVREQDLQIKRMEGEARWKDKAKVRADVEKIINSAELSCRIKNAELVGIGEMLENGKKVPTHIYEVACIDSVGFILQPQGTQQPRMVSCFEAAIFESSGKIKSDSAFLCKLPENGDVKVTAAALLTKQDRACAVSAIRWMGITASRQTEFTEVSCADGSGYLLQIPRINSDASVAAINCADAARQGLRCRLSDSGPIAQPLTMQSYLDALKQHGVSCEPVQLRVIGREVTNKRYVVEAQCIEQPKGIVAYLPLEGNTNKFEMIDCDAALQRNIRCKFIAKP